MLSLGFPCDKPESFAKILSLLTLFRSLSRLSRHEIVKYFDARAKSNIEKSSKERADEKFSQKITLRCMNHDGARFPAP
jgi:hypothetical protein